MGFNESKRFNGIKYSLVAIHTSKLKAIEYKNTIKRGGGLARVVKIKNGEYKVYAK